MESKQQIRDIVAAGIDALSKHAARHMTNAQAADVLLGLPKEVLLDRALDVLFERLRLAAHRNDLRISPVQINAPILGEEFSAELTLKFQWHDDPRHLQLVRFPKCSS
jgi:hypothetical protein